MAFTWFKSIISSPLSVFLPHGGWQSCVGKVVTSLNYSPGNQDKCVETFDECLETFDKNIWWDGVTLPKRKDRWGGLTQTLRNHDVWASERRRVLLEMQANSVKVGLRNVSVENLSFATPGEGVRCWPTNSCSCFPLSSTSSPPTPPSTPSPTSSPSWQYAKVKTMCRHSLTMCRTQSVLWSLASPWSFNSNSRMQFQTTGECFVEGTPTIRGLIQHFLS